MKKKTTPIYILAALVWFGFHCGAGFASGAQVKLYSAKYGLAGLAVPFIAWAINVVFMYIACEYSRLIKAKSYREVGLSIYWNNPIVGKVALFLWDVLIIMSSITILGSCVAGCGAQLQQLFGMPYWIGCTLFIVLMVLVLCFGKNILERLGKLSAPLVILFFIVCICGIVMNFDHLKLAMTSSLGAPTVKNYAPKMLFSSGFTYGLVQLGSFQVLTVMAGKFEKHSDTVKFIILGFLVNCGAMVASYLSLMAYYPDILKNTLPTLAIIQQFTGPLYAILIVAYNFVLVMAYITTAGGMAAGVQRRYLPVLNKRISNELVCNIIIVVGFFGAATAISTMGLDWILTTVNQINAFCRLYIWYIPIVILGPVAIHRVKKNLAQSEKI